MTTVVNNPGGGTTTDSSAGTLLTLLALLIIAILFFVYGLPAIRSAATPSVNVPSRIDVNIPNTENAAPANPNGGTQ